MRRDDALVLDMLIAAEKITRFAGRLSFEQFEQDEMAQSAVMREIQVLGEAARMIRSQTKQRYPQVAWAAITGMRNRIVHEYFNIDPEILWLTVQLEIPELIVHLKHIAADLSQKE